MSIKKRFFWDLIAKHYSKQEIANMQAYQKKLEQTKALYNSSSSIFEFGCGTGSTAIYHAPNVDKIYATDISPKMVIIAKSKAQKAKIHNIKFDCKSIEEISVTEESFDIVLAMSVLHLVENPKEVITKINSMLKPGGYLVCSTACIQDGFPSFKYIAKLGYFFWLLPLVKSFSKDKLISEIEKAGFEIQKQWQPSLKEAVFIIAKKIS